MNYPSVVSLKAPLKTYCRAKDSPGLVTKVGASRALSTNSLILMRRR